MVTTSEGRGDDCPIIPEDGWSHDFLMLLATYHRFGTVQPNAELDDKSFKPSGIPGFQVQHASATPERKR
jgi:hypothetical protein